MEAYLRKTIKCYCHNIKFINESQHQVSKDDILITGLSILRSTKASLTATIADELNKILVEKKNMLIFFLTCPFNVLILTIEYEIFLVKSIAED